MRSTLLMMAFCGLLAGGCGGRQQTETAQRTAIDEYGALPALKATPDKKLRDELARIVEEGATPELIGRSTVSETQNVAVGLAGLFDEKKIDSILAESEKVFPPGRFKFDPIRLQRAINFRKKYGTQQVRARDALRRPQCDFGIRFLAGLTAELKFVDVVRICARLEAFQAAESLAEDDPDEAIEALEFMLRLASCLGAEKHAMCRLEAAFLRTEAFGVLQEIASDDRIPRKRLERLHAMVEKQMAAWPPDADAWIGDRAMGLHAYEMVRAGNLVEMLTEEEIVRFQEEDVLRELLTAATHRIDGDELYYLLTMREIIDACSEAYYARLPLFDSIGNDLQEKRNSPDFPIVAAWVLLLPEVRKGHAMQAQDRANWEAWALTLALATGREMPPYEINPLTGKKYLCEKLEESIEVTGFGSGAPGDTPLIIVPKPDD